MFGQLHNASQLGNRVPATLVTCADAADKLAFSTGSCTTAAHAARLAAARMPGKLLSLMVVVAVVAADVSMSVDICIQSNSKVL